MLMYTIQFTCSVVSNSLQPHRLKHARPLCPSPTPGVYPNSSPLSQGCHPTISSSVVPFFSRLQSFQASGSFQMSQLFASDSQNIGVSASASVLPINSQDLPPLRWSSRHSQESSSTPQFKGINSSVLIFLYSTTLTAINNHWKNRSLDQMDLCWQSNLSAFYYAVWVGHNFPVKEKASFNFMAAVTVCSDFGAQKYSLPLFPLFLHLFAMKRWGQMP